MNTIPKAQLFEPLLRLSVGMDDMFNHLETLSTKSTYPPHDIIKVNDTDYRINMALAGFTKDEISVSMDAGYLAIEGVPLEKPKNHTDVTYIYRGISARRFTKTFRLAEDIDIKDATFANGMLSISLYKIPHKNTIKVIEIK